MNCVDLVGKTFGRLTVLEKLQERKSGNVVWRCRCECGNNVNVTSHDLKTGHTKSCGCYRRDRTIEVKKKYYIEDKKLQHKLYVVWYNIKERCYKKTDKSYHYYGERGIKVCDEWKNDFMAFFNWSISNGYKDGLTIDRIDVNGNYEPSNCRWATFLQQMNNRRSNHNITMDGITMSKSDWCRKLGINERLVTSRIKQGWDDIDALTTKVNNNKRFFTIENETKRLSDWCRMYSIDKGTVRNRLKKGWSIEKALKTTPINNHIFITIGGVTKLLSEWCKINGVNKSTALQRVRLGWNLEEAVTKPAKF